MSPRKAKPSFSRSQSTCSHDSIPAPVLESAQKLILAEMTAAVMQGKRSPLLHDFVITDDTHGRFAFMIGILHDTPYPHWFNYIERAEVWKAACQVGQFMEYAVFYLAQVPVTVTIDDGRFWVAGLYAEPYSVAAYCTCDNRSFWVGHPYLGYAIEFLSQWLLLH